MTPPKDNPREEAAKQMRRMINEFGPIHQKERERQMAEKKDSPLEAGVMERDLEKASRIVEEVEVARMNDTAYLTVEDLKQKIAQALSEERERAGRKYRDRLSEAEGLLWQMVGEWTAEEWADLCRRASVFLKHGEALGDREEGKS